MSRYDDIIHLSRPESSHPKMRREDRAKLFAPFAALNGHDAAVHARDKVLLPKSVMTQHTQEALDRKLRRLKKGDTVTAVYFVARKQTVDEVLGEYLNVCDTVIRADANDRVLYLRDQMIFFDDLMDIRGVGFEEAEDENEFMQ